MRDDIANGKIKQLGLNADGNASDGEHLADVETEVQEPKAEESSTEIKNTTAVQKGLDDIQADLETIWGLDDQGDVDSVINTWPQQVETWEAAYDQAQKPSEGQKAENSQDLAEFKTKLDEIKDILQNREKYATMREDIKNELAVTITSSKDLRSELAEAEDIISYDAQVKINQECLKDLPDHLARTPNVVKFEAKNEEFKIDLEFFKTSQATFETIK